MKRLFLMLILLFCIAFTTQNASSVVDGGEWDSSVNFDVTVYGNNFHKVILKSYYGNPCEVEACLKFYAPNNDYYRFQAKVTFESGAWMRSEIFYNSTWGEREFKWTYNTDNQGCWGEDYQKPSYLEVHGCLGSDCTPKPF